MLSTIKCKLWLQTHKKIVNLENYLSKYLDVGKCHIRLFIVTYYLVIGNFNLAIKLYKQEADLWLMPLKPSNDQIRKITITVLTPT